MLSNTTTSKSFNHLKNEIAHQLQNRLNFLASDLQKKSPESSDIYTQLGQCPKPELGQLTFACFALAKSWQLPPAQLATLLQQTFNSQPATTLIAKCINTGPYLNITLHKNSVLALLLSKVKDKTYFQPKFFDHYENIMVEYSQPNTHKEMHVGHMRNVCLGKAIADIYQYLGHQVTTCTYPGDMGTHVAKCLWYFKKNNLTPPVHRKGAWLGTIYSKAHLELESKRGTEEEEKNRNELTFILKEMHSGQGEYFNLWKTTREWSLELMKDTYRWINVTFNYWFFESEVDQKSVALVHEYFKKGIFKQDQGAIGIDLSEDNLGFCLLLKSDGNGLYATKDIELARYKFENFKISKNIYVVDNRQSLHFKQVFKTLEKIGYHQLAKNSFHLAYEMVELPDGAMSSRKGNIIPIQMLTDQMEQTIKDQFLLKYKNEWPDEEIQQCSHLLANAAIKYGMLKIDPNKKIIFDLPEWLKIDGNSGPYLLYSYARVSAILQKANFNNAIQHSSFEFSENAETDLLMKMWLFNEAILESAEKNSPNILCNYLYELCQQLNTFYAQCSIMHATTDLSKQTRLHLLDVFQQILKHGLGILNIQVVQRM